MLDGPIRERRENPAAHAAAQVAHVLPPESLRVSQHDTGDVARGRRRGCRQRVSTGDDAAEKSLKLIIYEWATAKRAAKSKARSNNGGGAGGNTLILQSIKNKTETTIHRERFCTCSIPRLSIPFKMK